MMADYSPSGQAWGTPPPYTNQHVAMPDSAGRMGPVVTAAGPVVTVSPATVSIQHPPSQVLLIEGRGYGDSTSRVKTIWRGSVLIFAAVLAFIGVSVGICYYVDSYIVITGLWCGSVFLTTGAVSIATVDNTTIKMIKASIGIAAAAVACGATLLILSSIIVFDDCYYYEACNYDAKRACHYLLITASSTGELFGIILLVGYSRALCAAQTTQAMAGQVHYASSAPERVQMNGQPDNQHPTLRCRKFAKPIRSFMDKCCLRASIRAYDGHAGRSALWVR